MQTTGYRATPDVAFDADPNTGVPVYVTPTTCWRRWQTTQQAHGGTFGGTSLGSPAWAGIIAIADQGRAAGLGSLDGPTQTLPALRRSLVRLPHGRARFLIIRRRRRVRLRLRVRRILVLFWFFGGSGLGVSATTTSTSTGANTATGLGSPNGPELVRCLVASTLTTPLTPVTGSGGGTTPTPPPKPVGGGSRTSSSPHPPRQPHDQVG